MSLVSKKNIYMLALFVFILLSIIIIPTYAKFEYNVTGNEIVSASLNFDVGITNIEEYERLTIGARNTHKFNVQVTNNSGALAYYGVWYRMSTPTVINSDIKIGRLNGTETPTSGSIDIDGVITINGIIINNTDSDIAIDIGVASSDIDTSSIEYLGGKYLITGDIPEITYLNKMSVGSYVKYVGVGGTVGEESVACQNDETLSSSGDENTETEAPLSCQGQNAREGISEENTYGYCYSSNNKYNTTGWRIAYIDNKKVAIISAGSPECNNRTSSGNNIDYIKKANALALKYCNEDYVDGDCTCISTASGMCDEPSSDAWVINNDTYNKITAHISQTIGGYIAPEITDATNCVNSQDASCGYDNDLIDNGGYYWLAIASDSLLGTHWNPTARVINTSEETYAYGLRPVISLSSSVFVIGGTGTMTDPYIISNDINEIN